MNALDLLKEGHETVSGLFKQFETSTSRSDTEQIVERIRSELATHAHLEESIFYPTLEDQNDQDLIELVDESLEEHQEVKDLLKEIEGLTTGGQPLRSKVMELREKVEHHAAEEEAEMFPRVRTVLTAEDLERMGVEIAAEKEHFAPVRQE
jgi:iron-sulfur cluster repair protein YtfE (RIC family)